jgi:hypothetical protein
MADQHLLQREGRDRFKLEVDLRGDLGAFDTKQADEEAIDRK